MKNILLFFGLLISSAVFSQITPPATSPGPGNDTDKVLQFAEKMPEFPGGSDAFNKYLIRNLKYPAVERQNGVQGTVHITFVVEKDGSITNIQPIKEVPGGPGLTKETIRVISEMPKWTPGTINGNPVRVQITQPIKFTLDDGKKKKKKR